MKNKNFTIIAGPCSIDSSNFEEVLKIAKIKVGFKRVIAGTRVVGLKSRSALDQAGVGMGMDYPVFKKNLGILLRGGSSKDFKVPPSVKLAEKIVKETELLVATEVMEPLVQLPVYEGRIPEGKLMLWNPAVNQLGWPILITAQYAGRNKWQIGIKNGKWLGTKTNTARKSKPETDIPIEKVWQGLTAYADLPSADLILIHRGFLVPEKGDLRSLPLHAVAKRTKEKTGARLFFDPSHSYGPKMRGEIKDAAIKAAKMKVNDNEYLYDGILIEVGKSQIDSKQHISIKELEDLVKELSNFRDLVGPESK